MLRLVGEDYMARLDVVSVSSLRVFATPRCTLKPPRAAHRRASLRYQDTCTWVDVTVVARECVRDERLAAPCRTDGEYPAPVTQQPTAAMRLQGCRGATAECDCQSHFRHWSVSSRVGVQRPSHAMGVRTFAATCVVPSTVMLPAASSVTAKCTSGEPAGPFNTAPLLSKRLP